MSSGSNIDINISYMDAHQAIESWLGSDKIHIVHVFEDCGKGLVAHGVIREEVAVEEVEP